MLVGRCRGLREIGARLRLLEPECSVGVQPPDGSTNASGIADGHDVATPAANHPAAAPVNLTHSEALDLQIRRTF